MSREKVPDTMRVSILVRPKDGILDPEGEAVERALKTLGFPVSHVRIGRLYDLVVDQQDAAKATGEIGKMCTDAFLVNPLMEKHEIVMQSVDPESNA